MQNTPFTIRARAVSFYTNPNGTYYGIVSVPKPLWTDLSLDKNTHHARLLCLTNQTCLVHVAPASQPFPHIEDQHDVAFSSVVRVSVSASNAFIKLHPMICDLLGMTMNSYWIDWEFTPPALCAARIYLKNI